VSDNEKLRNQRDGSTSPRPTSSTKATSCTERGAGMNKTYLNDESTNPGPRHQEFEIEQGGEVAVGEGEEVIVKKREQVVVNRERGGG